jgi:hypothetical protein
MSHTCTPTLIVVSEGRNRTIEWNVKWPAIRAWGQYHSRILDRWAANAGRSEGATAVKAVPFLCAARRSLSSRSVHMASCSCLALQLECIVEFCSPSYMSVSPSRTPQELRSIESINQSYLTCVQSAFEQRRHDSGGSSLPQAAEQAFLDCQSEEDALYTTAAASAPGNTQATALVRAAIEQLKANLKAELLAAPPTTGRK